MSDKLILSSEEFSIILKQLVDSVARSNIKYTKIVGIASGGLPVSLPLSKMLNIPHHKIKVSFYGESREPKAIPVVDMYDTTFENDDLILFVDDLIDSGSTFNYLNKNFSHIKYDFLVVCSHKDNKFGIIPKYYHCEKPNCWVQFPWE